MLSSFLAICMIFSMLPISAFAADYAMDYDLVVTGSVSNVKAGEETKVELWVKNNVGGLYSLDWQIKYDTEAYEIKAGSLNSWAPDGMTNVSANANIAGQINGGAFIIMSAVETVADTKVCEVTFVAKKDITEPVSFTAGQKSNGTAFADETYYHKVFVDGPTGNTNVAIAVIIEEATVALAAPVKKGTPVTTVEGTNFAGTVTWSPEVGEVFAANTEYTANVTLTANEGYAFEGATPVVADAEISDVTVSADGKTMTFKAKFAATAGHVDADGLWETDGEKHWHTCACGDKIDEGTHEGGEATCVAKAKCEVCGAEYGEVNAENHKGETEVRDALNPSCKDAGYTGDTYCLDCGKMILKGEVIPATGNHIDANDAWETDGENHWHTCACETVFDVDAHKGGEATCAAKAKCEVCGAEYGELNAENHKGETEVRDALNPSCKDDGYTGDTYCLDCGAMILKGEVIPATGNHIDANDAWETDGENHWHTCACETKFDVDAHKGGEATCVAKAKCEVCGAEYGELNADNHKGETEVRDALNPSCKDAGYTGDTYCLDCGAMILKGEVIPATGEHVDANDAWETDGENHWHTCACGTEFDVDAHKGGEATCVAKAKCEVCGAEYGELNAENHKGETEVRDALNPSCKDDGYTGDTYCLDCGEMILKGEVIPATGEHVDANDAWETDGENHWHTCACGTEFDKAAHDWAEANCTEPKTCKVCALTEGEALGHSHDMENWKTDKTSHWHQCACGDKIDVAEHVYGDDKYCDICGYKKPAKKPTTVEPEQPIEPEVPAFEDVAEDAYYADAVQWAVENEVTNGMTETTFAPDAICTRAQAVTFLWRAAGAPAPESDEMPFTDVAEGAYYYDAVLWAIEQGITNGTSETTFSPDMTVTRAHVVTFLWRMEGAEEASSENPFVDVEEGTYYYDAVLWAVENEITNGMSEDTFVPANGCTRGQIVTFIYRCMAE